MNDAECKVSDDVDITDFVDNGRGYEGNNSNKGNESDDDDKKADGYNNYTKEVIVDCAAGTQCKAPPSANLEDSPHSCWGCNKKIHSSLLCGESILNLLSNNPSYIGRSLSNGCVRFPFLGTRSPADLAVAAALAMLARAASCLFTPRKWEV